MARSIAGKRSAPRKSALAKAALRQTRAGPSRSMNMNSDERRERFAARPTVDFEDPLMRHAAMQAKGISLCAFLVTLAAFQRGLKVTFHQERASFDPRFENAKVQGHRGEIFSIGNGAHVHVFSRTLGDRTNPVADAIAEDKHLTKNALRQAGVSTPAGIVVDRSQKGTIERFMAHSASKRFVVKPHNGSLGKGVKVDLVAGEVFGFVESANADRLVIEEHVSGLECRATVIDGRCVAVSKRNFAVVTGVGQTTIAGLIEGLNLAYRQNPYLSDLMVTHDMRDFLLQQGLSLSSVPSVGQRVQLLNKSGGESHEDVTQSIPEQVKSEAVRAASAVGLPSCGVDLILTPSGRVVVLELNQRCYIGMHSFPLEGPGQGNAVAEAIIDYYFPETIGNPTHPELAYDFAPVRAALESSQLAEVTLPVICPDWTCRRIVASGMSANSIVKLVQAAAQAAGAYVMSAPLAQGGVGLSLACAPINFKRFLHILPEPYRRGFAVPAKSSSEWA